MFLHRIHLNPRRKSVRHDLADPYQMHATLCRIFFPEGTKCPPGALLWRLEPEIDVNGQPRILIQCGATPEWSRIPDPEWLAQADPGIDVEQKLGIDTLAAGQQFRFRLRANPCKTVQSKRQGITQPGSQREWLTRKGMQHGFALPESPAPDYFNFLESSNGHVYQDFRISQEQMLGGRQHDGNAIRVYSALFDGRLTVTDVTRFKKALKTGIGHGKVMGLGLLSVVPIR